MQQSAALKCEGCSTGCAHVRRGSSLLAPSQHRVQLPQQFINLSNFAAKSSLTSSRRASAASECSQFVLMKTSPLATPGDQIRCCQIAGKSLLWMLQCPLTMRPRQMPGISSKQLCALALLALVPLVSFLPSASSHKVTRYIYQLHRTNRLHFQDCSGSSTLRNPIVQ